MAGAHEMREQPLRAWLVLPPRIRRGEVHVILARLPPPASPRGIPPVLDFEERRRKRGLAFAADRHRFAWSHSLLRLVLGRYLGQPAAAVRFARVGDARSRPMLAPGARLRFCFSLSHSGDFVAIAIGNGATVGIDVETFRPRLDPLAIARAYFAASEIAVLEGCPSAKRALIFLQMWTAKEAVLKAIGTGLARSPADAAMRFSCDGRMKLREIADTPRLAVWLPAHMNAIPGRLTLATPRATSASCLWIGAAMSVKRTMFRCRFDHRSNSDRTATPRSGFRSPAVRRYPGSV